MRDRARSFRNIESQGEFGYEFRNGIKNREEKNDDNEKERCVKCSWCGMPEAWSGVASLRHKFTSGLSYLGI